MSRSGEDDESALRESLIAALRALDVQGLNRGSTGNLSRRCRDGMLITPTGMGADDLAAADLAWVSLDDGRVRGRWRPSSESPFHAALYVARPELQAIVHVHSPHATALACLRRELPPFHYMVAVAGGSDVRCAPYHLFGSEALSAAVVQAMADRKACLLANHGLVAAGATLAEAMKVTREIEALCGMYLAALAAGEPVRLSDDEMAAVLVRFASYGQRQAGSG